MIILEKEKEVAIVDQDVIIEEEISKEDLCKKICENVLQGLLEGYEDLKVKNPEKVKDFQPKIEDLQQQIQENQVKKQIEKAFSV